MVKQFELNPTILKPDAHFVHDLKLDSLDAVDMIVCIEHELKIKVSGESFSQVKTLGDIYNLIYEMQKITQPQV